MMEKHITTFCSACDKRPEIFVNYDNEQGRQIIINDAFGNNMYMSEEQLWRCPKIFIDNTKGFDKQVIVIDDFGNQIYLSKEQLEWLAIEACEHLIFREQMLGKRLL
jgi:hypothetical protein